MVWLITDTKAQMMLFNLQMTAERGREDMTTKGRGGGEEDDVRLTCSSYPKVMKTMKFTEVFCVRRTLNINERHFSSCMY